MKTFLIILLYGTTDICLGLTDTITTKKIILGVSAGIMAEEYENSFDYSAHLTVEKGKSFFAVGPIIGQKPILDNSANLSNPRFGQYQLTGFHFVYQINPNPKGKRFNFYFQNEFMFHYTTDKGVNQFYYTQNFYNPIPVIKSYKSHQTLIEDFISTGFKVRILKNFYINQSIGIGLFYSSTVVDFGENNYNKNWHDIEPDIILKMGVGYTFSNKLKPATN